ncbi:MAG: Ig-like domain-containing protein [Acidobacteriaceae bacterium]
MTAGQSLQTTVEVFPVNNFAPMGAVCLYNGTKLLCTGTLANGEVNFTTSLATAGAYTLTAKFAGNANIAASTSLPTPVYVVPASTTTLAASSNSVAAGTVVTLTANVTSSGASVARAP